MSENAFITGGLSRSMRPCACGCGRMIGVPFAINGWREDCAARVLSEIEAIAGSAVLAAMAADAGALNLARALGRLPFEVDHA